MRPRLVLLASLCLVAATAGAQTYTVGDTLTVIQRPLPNLPSIVRPGDALLIECEADPAADDWTATLVRGTLEVPVAIVSAAYDPSTLWWRLACTTPDVPVFDLYDLRVTASTEPQDTARRAVKVVPIFRDDFTVAHLTDTHLPTYLYWYQEGADTDSSTAIGLRTITDDLDIIDPAFVVITGDFIHEGELEDFRDKRYYSRAMMQLNEFAVPTYLTAGNHDVGGWNDTPPSDGTARRDWWRFFGWKRLGDPPPGAPARTQDYSFDYGGIHFTALESYDNYDGWRWSIYGGESFTDPQLDWLDADLAAASGQARRVLLTHYDFQGQLDLADLGVDLSLSGHIHRGEDAYAYPMDVVTDNSGGPERPFRLVRFSGGDIDPNTTLEAHDADILRVDYAPANDGAHDEVVATVTNGYRETFPRGLLRIRMPGGAIYTAEGGTLTQVDDSGDHAVCYVEVVIPARGEATVTVVADKTNVSAPAAGATRLLGASPNPFNPRTEVAFTLAEPADCRLTVFDVRGQRVAVLAEGRHAAGRHTAQWDGRSRAGVAMPSGTYLVALRSGSYVETRKLVLAR